MYSTMHTLSQSCSAVTIKPAGPDTNLPKYTVTNTLPCTLKHTHIYTHTHTHRHTHMQWHTNTHTYTLHTHADYTYTVTHVHWPFCNLLMTKRWTCKPVNISIIWTMATPTNNTQKSPWSVTRPLQNPHTFHASFPLDPTWQTTEIFCFSHDTPHWCCLSVSGKKQKTKQKRHMTQRWVHHHLSFDFIYWSLLVCIILGSQADSLRSWCMLFWM